MTSEQLNERGPRGPLLPSMIHDLLAEAVSRVKRECLHSMLTLEVKPQSRDAVHWPAPGLRPDIKLFGFDLDQLAPVLYADQRTAAEAWDLWATICQDFELHRRRTLVLIHEQFPQIAWGDLGQTDPKVRLAQVLYMLSWHIGPFMLRNGIAQVKSDRGLMRLDRHGAEWGKNRRRFRERLAVPIDKALRLDFGFRNPGGLEAGALYRLLASHFPDQVSGLAYLFKVLTHAQAEDIALDAFDVHEFKGRQVTRRRIWDIVLSLNDHAITDPADQIVGLLSRTTMDPGDLREAIGYGSNRPHTPERRDEYRTKILKLRLKWANRHKKPEEPEMNPELIELMKLQEMIR